MGTLDDAPIDKGFRFCNGTVAMNLYQLVDTIEHTDDGVFYCQIDSDHNDFANWIHDIFKDDVLNSWIKGERDKYWFVQKVRHRLKMLEEQN